MKINKISINNNKICKVKFTNTNRMTIQINKIKINNQKIIKIKKMNNKQM